MEAGRLSRDWEWGLLPECPLLDKAEPGTAFLAFVRKCQAQLPWLIAFHLGTDLKQVS